MKRQRGMASITMVLLLLVLGSLLLSGLNQQYQALAGRVASESRRIRDAADAHSALEWGRSQRWLASAAWQCRQPTGVPLRVCLRIFTDGTLLLSTTGQSARRWWSGKVVKGAVVFSPRGWSDFCPLKEETLCQSP
ncbi:MULTISPECIES: DUF2509 family protein [unclassified Enterobacter]|uniref:DUF2509 family protein n=1 Tax=unclassified Enterobacter TaxID=2608935 RepID=UPI000F482533|nr:MULTISPECIES: DUF2509 family protein [unclassified Enterobacter]